MKNLWLAPVLSSAAFTPFPVFAVANESQTLSQIAPARPDPLKIEIVHQIAACRRREFKTFFGNVGYFPRFTVTYSRDGTLVSEPNLRNPPANEDERRAADSALSTLKKCQPLHLTPSLVKDQSFPYTRTIGIDPSL